MSLVLKVEFLAGRYTATQYNDRDRPEWPPHPVRLFSAMVATWADAEEPDPAERSALEWLERQGRPLVLAQEDPIERAVVTHYVAVNDTTALTRDVSRTYSAFATATAGLELAERTGDRNRIAGAARQLRKAESKAKVDSATVGTPTGRETKAIASEVVGLLPEMRAKQPRTYPTFRLDEPIVRFVWPEARPTEERAQALDGLLARVGRLGHSSTPVSCSLLQESEQPEPVDASRALVPRSGGNIRLRVPAKGLVDALERQFAQHQGEEPRTLPASIASYGYLEERPSAPRSMLSGDWIILGLPKPPAPALRLTRVLDLTRAVRAALMKQGPQPAPEIISGHRPGGARTRPSERPHMAVLPLANVSNRYSDGTMHGVAVALPLEATDDEREAVELAVLGWQEANGMQLRLAGRAGRQIELHLEPISLDRADPAKASLEHEWFLETELASGQPRVATQRWRWTAESRRWMSVTPIALDRFPGDLRSSNPRHRDSAEKKAQASIARACLNIGLPQPAYVGLWLGSTLPGVPQAGRWSRPGRGRSATRGPATFPTFRSGSSKQVRIGVHAEVEFAEPVEGPVVLGAGRYLGYGLCLPADPLEESHG